MGDPPIIHKDGVEMSRIHVKDLARILFASIENPKPGAIYNCVDDLPTAPEAPLELAYDLLGKPKPQAKNFADIEESLGPRQKTQYQDCSRISNSRIKLDLGVELMFPTYKEGYEALAAARAEAAAADAAEMQDD